MSKKPVALIIMDGFGYNKDTFGNAIAAANKPNIDKYLQVLAHLDWCKRSGRWSAGWTDGQLRSWSHQHRCW